jgi:hypothetical protein
LTHFHRDLIQFDFNKSGTIEECRSASVRHGKVTALGQFTIAVNHNPVRRSNGAKVYVPIQFMPALVGHLKVADL